MAGFHDLVLAGQPAILSDGCQARATEGMTWEWTITGFNDAAGNPVDLSAVTATCTIYDSPAATTTVTTLTATGTAGGAITISKDEAATVNLAAGADSRGQRICYWSLKLNNGTDTVAVWTAPVSKFIITKG